MPRWPKFAVLTVFFACLSAICWLYGAYAKKMAMAEQAFAVFDFTTADRYFADLEEKLSRLDYLPGLDKSLRHIRVRRNQTAYWKKDYASLALKRQNGQSSSAMEHFIYGNAAWRQSASQDDENEAKRLMQVALDEYAQAIRGDPENFDAAFNYEWILRKKSEQNDKSNQNKKQSAKENKNNSKQGDNENQPNIHGQSGKESSGQAEKMKVFIPETGDEKKNGPGTGKNKFKRKNG